MKRASRRNLFVRGGALPNARNGNLHQVVSVREAQSAGYLLPHHDAVTLLASPTIGRPFALSLPMLADQLPDFFLHQQLHRLQAGLTD